MAFGQIEAKIYLRLCVGLVSQPVEERNHLYQIRCVVYHTMTMITFAWETGDRYVCLKTRGWAQHMGH